MDSITKNEGFELAARLSLTKTVPASVPSLFHISTPFSPVSALKNKVPLTLVNPSGAAEKILP